MSKFNVVFDRYRTVVDLSQTTGRFRSNAHGDSDSFCQTYETTLESFQRNGHVGSMRSQTQTAASQPHVHSIVQFSKLRVRRLSSSPTDRQSIDSLSSIDDDELSVVFLLYRTKRKILSAIKQELMQ